MGICGDSEEKQIKNEIKTTFQSDLSAEEIDTAAELLAELAMQKYDKNNDGKLDDKES